ncbi:FHA domain-containing protein [Noviherbaspirillum humi]|uniref:FHA domain-containing protein n=1 Tax=Noviherbaspirillum humi TaxID=1688639 RepID=A0A239KVE6_9BURK|nr:FHA domain-containing protein [Noviherbaspirillum humi]SNT22181.1 FHA domain-containing protein [Noviherbaspirillum humi]
MFSQKMAPPADEADDRTSALNQHVVDYDIVLRPLSHPELGDIFIGENLFAIGRNEPPFDSYAPEITADLSRRHARIFSEYGAVYIADLDSKNGTTVNGVDIQQKISRLHDGDEICFGKALAYQVSLGPRARTHQPSARLVSLTLTPQREDIGLQPIVITQFPFLISKADDAFARYKDDFPHQVQYLSRRHAHIFLKAGAPFIEDLGSTNGTFVNDERLEERAVPLKDGDVISFGGRHFVYGVSLQTEIAQIDPTVTKLSPLVREGAPQAADTAAPESAAASDKTTFVAAADSFLNIFCIDQAQNKTDAVPEAEEAAPDVEPGKRHPRGKYGTLAAAFMQALGDGGGEKGRLRWVALAATAALAIAAGVAYFGAQPESEVKDLIAAGRAEQAVPVASQALARRPDSTELRSLAAEAVLKTYLPAWIAAQKEGNFDRAAQSLASMRQAGQQNPDMQPMLAELEWLGRLDSFAASHRDAGAPLRIFAEEEQIQALLAHWDQDTQAHQRQLEKIAAYVPEFRETYATGLSHLRRLQSDNAVYLAAMARLKAAIETELGRDNPGALNAVLDDYAQKFPRLAGMDQLRHDLQRYLEIDAAARERRLGALAVRLENPSFSTPPFQAKLRAVASSDRFPPPDVLRQYQPVAKAWREGDARAALGGLQQMKAASWQDAVTRETARKQALLEQHTAVQKGRGNRGQDERLLQMAGMLDPEEDVYFLRALEPELTANRAAVLAKAREHVAQSEQRWRRYQETGGIDASLRLESTLSPKFREQARLLRDAHEDVARSIRIHRQLKAEYPPQWERFQADIDAEAALQRSGLQEQQAGANPALIRAKLQLLEGGTNEK